jgi:hypothetical protein
VSLSGDRGWTKATVAPPPGPTSEGGDNLLSVSSVGNVEVPVSCESPTNRKGRSFAAKA